MPVETMTPATAPPTRSRREPSAAASVVALAREYDRAREAVRTGPRFIGRGRARLPGFRPAVQLMLDDHASRRAAQLEGELHAAAARGASEEPLVPAAHLRAGLRPVPYRRLLLGTIVAVLAAALAIIAALRAVGVDELDRDRGGLRRTFAESADLVDDVSQALLTLDLGALPEVADRLRGATAGSVAFVTLLFVFATYLVLRPLVPSFRVKRTVLAAARAAEGQAFRQPRAELPLDLIVLAVPMLIPLYVGSFMLIRALAVQWSVPAVVDGILLLAIAAARLRYLAVMARRRRAG